MTNSARRANHFPIYGKHVKPLTQKYSAFQNTQISGISPSIPPGKGTDRDRHETWGGMRWTLGVRQLCCRTKRSQRTAKSCGPGAATVASIMPACAGGNGDKKRRSPGRARISRQTIAWGRPGCLGCTCQTRVRSFYHCTRCCGRSQRPAFPAPSVRKRDDGLQNPGKNVPRECGGLSPSFRGDAQHRTRNEIRAHFSGSRFACPGMTRRRITPYPPRP